MSYWRGDAAEASGLDETVDGSTEDENIGRGGEQKLVGELEDLVTTIVDQVTAPGVNEKREQEAGLERAISELERIGAPVSGDLRSLRQSLRQDLARFDEAKARVSYLRSALARLLNQLDVALPPDVMPRESSHSRRAASTPRGFVLDGTYYPATRWIDLLSELCRVLAERHGTEFEQVLSLAAFNRNPDLLRRPMQIVGTDIYMTRNLSASPIMTLAFKMVRAMGYREDQFAILEPE